MCPSGNGPEEITEPRETCFKLYPARHQTLKYAWNFAATMHEPMTGPINAAALSPINDDNSPPSTAPGTIDTKTRSAQVQGKVRKAMSTLTGKMMNCQLSAKTSTG